MLRSPRNLLLAAALASAAFAHADQSGHFEVTLDSARTLHDGVFVCGFPLFEDNAFSFVTRSPDFSANSSQTFSVDYALGTSDESFGTYPTGDGFYTYIGLYNNSGGVSVGLSADFADDATKGPASHPGALGFDETFQNANYSDVPTEPELAQALEDYYADDRATREAGEYVIQRFVERQILRSVHGEYIPEDGAVVFPKVTVLNSYVVGTDPNGTLVTFSDAARGGKFGAAAVPNPVPEPAPFAALGLGALALFRRRR